MEHVVYILYSFKHRKSYIGETASLISRFHSHNTFAKKGWTVKYRPWMVLHLEVVENRKEALRREKWLKTGAGN
ncbi:MAG: GIY-YIG nuclease family protein [Leeuwenhoekiella sp.]